MSTIYDNTTQAKDIKHQEKRLREILAFLDKLESVSPKLAKTLTDEQLETFNIQLFDLDLKTGETDPSVTRYSLPAADDAPGISSYGTDPIDDDFTRYNKSNTKRVYGDVQWPDYLWDAFIAHANNQGHNVFESPWNELILDYWRRGRLYYDGHGLDVKSGSEYGGWTFSASCGFGCGG